MSFLKNDKLSLVVERPQHMLMRVAVGIHKADIDAAVEVSRRNLKVFV